MPAVEATRSGVDVSVNAAAEEFQTAMTVPALLACVPELQTEQSKQTVEPGVEGTDVIVVVPIPSAV